MAPVGKERPLERWLLAREPAPAQNEEMSPRARCRRRAGADRSRRGTPPPAVRPPAAPPPGGRCRARAAAARTTPARRPGETRGMREGPGRLGIVLERKIAVRLEDELLEAEAVLAQQVLGLIEAELAHGRRRCEALHRRARHRLKGAEVRVVQQALAFETADEAEDLPVPLALRADHELGRGPLGAGRSGRPSSRPSAREAAGQLELGDEIAIEVLLPRERRTTSARGPSRLMETRSRSRVRLAPDSAGRPAAASGGRSPRSPRGG